jgi:acetoin utilization deacetylase AcuC-like enzyme
MPVKAVYSERYAHADVGDHPWPVHKYRDVHRKALLSGILSKDEVLIVDQVSGKDLERVHDPDYVRRFVMGELSSADLARAELPYSAELALLFLASAQGTIEACRHALENGAVYHIGGGFHHAFADHGSGFCMLNDIAVGIRKMQADNRIKKALVVDLDVHQGDGTAKIFQKDESVFTFSMHQENNFPYPKQKSTLDVGLDDGTEDAEYLAILKKALPKIIASHKPDLIVYVAGADPYKDDQLGGLALTMEGLAERDRVVYEEASKNKIPIATTLAGGYARNPKETTEIHFITLKASLALAAV